VCKTWHVLFVYIVYLIQKKLKSIFFQKIYEKIKKNKKNKIIKIINSNKKEHQ
jgi:hypothetical protein